VWFPPAMKKSLRGKWGRGGGGGGYLMKEAVSDQLVTAIHRVLEGGNHVSKRLSDHLIGLLGGAADSLLKVLTDREIEVFEWIGRGLSLEEIGVKLGIGARTVEAHRTNIRKRLRLPDANALLRHAVRWVQSGDLSNLSK